MARWRVRVIDLAGAGTGFVRTAEVLPGMVDPLNELAECRIRFSAFDPTAALLLARVDGDDELDIVGCLHREVQVWCDGVLMLEGPAPQFRIPSTGVCEARVFSFDWWLARRMVGRADRVNLLVDGDFESVTLDPAWVETGGSTATVETAHPATGDRYVSVDGSGWLEQTFDFTTTFPPGLEPRFAVRFRLPTGSTPPADNSWFFVGADDDPGITVHKINPDTIAVDTWYEWVFGLGRRLLPGTTWNVTVGLRGGTGGLEYDDARAAQPESIGAIFGGSDPADVAALLVDYFQDPANGKDDVRILAVSHPTGGRTDTAWQGANHETYPRVMRQLYEMEGGIDVRRDYATRTLHFEARRGAYKPALPLRLGRTMTAAQTVVDGAEAANSSVVIGTGGDFTRNEGGFIVATDVPILERIDHAPVSMPLREYDTWAEELATQGARPVESIEPDTTWGVELVTSGAVQTGDEVLTHLVVGEYRLRRRMRIVNLSIDPRRDTVTPELVPLPFEVAAS